jgi:hypothetical protein
MILAAGQRYVETLRVAMEPTTAARGVTPTAAPAA